MSAWKLADTNISSTPIYMNPKVHLGASIACGIGFGIICYRHGVELGSTDLRYHPIGSAVGLVFYSAVVGLFVYGVIRILK